MEAVNMLLLLLLLLFQSYVYEIMREWGTRFNLPLSSVTAACIDRHGHCSNLLIISEDDGTSFHGILPEQDFAEYLLNIC